MSVEAIWRQFRDQALSLANEWTLYQGLIIAASFLVAWALARRLTPPLEARLRTIEGRPRLMRLLVIPLRRLKWLLFALTLWLVSATMQQITWPSRSFLVALAANLALAWVVISIAARFIRKRDLARIFAIAAWLLVALELLGLLEPALTILDSLAFGLGAFRVSVLSVLKGVILLAVLLWGANVGSDFLDRRIRETLDLTPSLQVLIAKILKVAMLGMAVVISLSAIGLDLTLLTVFGGAFGLGLGFGLQKVASNLVSGVIILLDRSIKPGDVISLGDTFGWISSLKGRYVSVVTRDGVEYLIPNEDLITKEVVNWSFTNRNVRLEVRFGVSYGSDPHFVRALACKAASGIARVLSEPAPVCHLVAFGDSSIDFVLRFWIADPENGLTNVRGQVLLALWDAFKENDIQIPFPHREVILRRDGAADVPLPPAEGAQAHAQAKPREIADATTPAGAAKSRSARTKSRRPRSRKASDAPAGPKSAPKAGPSKRS